MNRTVFFKMLLLLLIFTSMNKVLLAQESGRDYYELRTYTFDNEEQKEATLTYLGTAFIPALNRMGISPVGVFEPLEAGEEIKLYVLITYPDLEDFTNLVDNLAGDEEYQKAATGYLKRPLKEPAYQRINSSFMKAFSSIPIIETPASGEHIIELRIYESHNEYAGNQKVKMFNEGELDIFYDTGLTPVFFGQSLVGENLPNLTYMLTFDNMEEREEAWKKFRVHPDWLSLKEEEQYKGTVSKVSNWFLKPLSISQL